MCPYKDCQRHKVSRHVTSTQAINVESNVLTSSEMKGYPSRIPILDPCLCTSPTQAHWHLFSFLSSLTISSLTDMITSVLEPLHASILILHALRSFLICLLLCYSYTLERFQGQAVSINSFSFLLLTLLIGSVHLLLNSVNSATRELQGYIPNRTPSYNYREGYS